MSFFLRCCYFLLLVAAVFFPYSAFANSANIPIICYHNLSPTTPGSMNMTPQTVETQLKWLKDNGFTVIPLREAVDYLTGKRDSLPPKPIVITADDGWQSQYTYLYPLAKKYNVPITFFIYPGTISQGKHAMTWDELKELQQNSLFDIEDHTYTHPNFKHEQKQLSPAAYEKFVEKELAGSKKVLEEKLNIKITLLAWPFGIYNDYLEHAAANAGYVMAFSIDDAPANKTYKPMAQPRFMLLQTQTMQSFEGKANRAGVKS
jgi:peptidoglycan/xylan/chitin deacetylase (PgdA/CDA1 family)